MGIPSQPDLHPTPASVTSSAITSLFLIRKRRSAQIAALCILMALTGWVGYLIHPSPAAMSPESQVPSFIPIPSHASLVRVETFLKEHVQNWYYTIPQLSEDDGLAFYQAQLTQKGWQCVTWMKNTNMSFYGQALSGTGVYITSLHVSSKAQIYLGDQEYGAWLLQDDLPEGAIALKISLEPSEDSSCPAGA